MKTDSKPPMFERNFDEKHYRELSKLVKNYENNSTGLFDQHILEQIIDFYEDNNELEKALDTADSAMGQYPFSSLFMLKKAQILFDLKQFDQANDLLDKALVLDAQCIQVFLLQADIQVWLGHFQKAVNILLDAISVIDDKDELPDLYLELADIYEEWQKYDKVFEALTATLHHEPQNEEALNRLWFCVELSESFEESITFHKAFIDENPYNHLAWFNLAHAYIGLGKFEEAIEAFEYVMAIDEDYEYAYKDCADVLKLTGDYEKAIDYYLQALSFCKPYKELYIKLGECFEGIEEYQRARNYYRKSISLDPYFDLAYNKIGHTYLFEEKTELAISFFQKACDLLKDCGIYLADLAEAFKIVGAFELADKYFEKAINAEEQDVSGFWAQWAISKMEEKEFKTGLDMILEAENASEESKANEEIQLLKFILLYMNGKKQEAYTLLVDLLDAETMDFEKALELYPELEQDAHVLSIVDSFSN